MAVNQYIEHLVILLEDEPYRDIVNGVKLSLNINESVIDVKNPCGGWPKVFEKLNKDLPLLNKYRNRNILLLMDFDDNRDDTQTSFAKRMNRFEKIVPEEYRNRVFLLGINHKESEDLKKIFQLSNFEKIGKLLIDDCPNGDLSHWENKHLVCNLSELDRMKKNGIFDWLFTT